VSTTSLNPDEIRAAAETHHELGPEYQSAVIESFLDKVGREIDARVDARLNGTRAPYPGPSMQPMPMGQPPAVRQGRSGSPFALAIVSLIAGIPLTGIALGATTPEKAPLALFLVWLGIAVINIAYAVSSRRSSGR
jgi:hypothetical protein